MLDRTFFYVVPSSEVTSFLSTFYGLYFSHQLHILQITNHAGPSVWAAIHVQHSGHFLYWDMGIPHDAILVFLWYVGIHVNKHDKIQL